MFFDNNIDEQSGSAILYDVIRNPFAHALGLDTKIIGGPRASKREPPSSPVVIARATSWGSAATVGRRRAAAMSVAFARMASALGLSGVSHHVLRHTGATVMVRGNVSLRAVHMIGGWSTLRMVER
jgi:integrase